MGKKGQAGGIKTAFINRMKALRNYYENPNICKECGYEIEILDSQKVKDVRAKVFCNNSCAAIFSNKRRDRIKWGKKHSTPQKVRPQKFSIYFSMTKGELFSRSRSWQSARGTIQKHARHTLLCADVEKVCKVCAYSNHVEVCHIKSVANFKDTDLITDINSIENLMYLCPNCHWEFDNGVLML